MSKFPSKDKIKVLLEKIESCEAARPLPEGADIVDRFKYILCREILLYKLHNDLTLDELSLILDVGKTDLSKIINYHIERYTIDKLSRLLVKIKPDFDFGSVA